MNNRHRHCFKRTNLISGLVVEYIVAIDVTRVRFPADACIIVSMLSWSFVVRSCSCGYIFASGAISEVRGNIVVSISACHAEDPGSIPGRGSFAAESGYRGRKLLEAGPEPAIPSLVRGRPIHGDRGLRARGHRARRSDHAS